MPNHQIHEGDEMTPHKLLKEKPDIAIGDTIEYISNNQMGYEKYKVITGTDGGKDLKLIDSYDHQIGIYDYESSDDEHADDSKKETGAKGGKRHKRKSHKNKSHKSKSHKNKSHKNKSNKRK